VRESWVRRLQVFVHGALAWGDHVMMDTGLRNTPARIWEESGIGAIWSEMQDNLVAAKGPRCGPWSRQSS
jgi:hypothetical protein